MQEPKYVIEAVLFGLLLLTGKWVTACLLLGVCAWDLRTYLRGEHKVRRQRRVQGGRWGLQPPGSACCLPWLWARQCASGLRQRRMLADVACVDAARAPSLASTVWFQHHAPVRLWHACWRHAREAFMQGHGVHCECNGTGVACHWVFRVQQQMERLLLPLLQCLVLQLYTKLYSAADLGSHGCGLIAHACRSAANAKTSAEWCCMGMPAFLPGGSDMLPASYAGGCNRDFQADTA